MSVSLTAANKQSLKRLLATGRWANESEIMRYGLHLVIEEARRKDFAPIPDAELAKCYAAMTDEEKAEEAALGRESSEASERAVKGEKWP